MKITIRQAKLFYHSVSIMKECGVSAKATKMLDLAMNKAKVEPMVLAFEKMQSDVNQKASEFNREISTAVTNEQVSSIRSKYSNVISQFEKDRCELETLLNEEKEIGLIMLKRSDLIIEEKNGGAAECIFGLLPCLEE